MGCEMLAGEGFWSAAAQLPLLYATGGARTYKGGGCGHRTPSGGDHTNEIHVWSGDRIVIQLEKFGPSTLEGRAVMATREWYDKTAED